MRMSEVAIAGIVLVIAAFGARYLLTASGLGLDLPLGVGARGYVLPLWIVCFWLLLIVGFLLVAVGVYRGRAH